MKKCPKCKKSYNSYPAISRVDDKTEICSSCGAAEAIAIAASGKQGIELKTNGLTELEKIIKERIVDIEMQNLETRRKEHSNKIKLGKQAKKMARG